MTSPIPRNRRSRSVMGSPLTAPMRALEQNTALDPFVAAGDNAASNVTANPTVRGLLQGRWLAHALHPVLVEIPIGTWASATLLDLVGDDRDQRAARVLTGAGLLAVVPTVLSGWAEYAETTTPEVKRVGVVHASVNAVGAGLQMGSWLARRGGRHGLGRVLSLSAISLVGLGGYLGGHLAIARNVGTADPAFDGS